jgi:hypothetical protein
MAEKNYLINEAIEIVYQAPNKEVGLTITAEIVLPNGSKDSNFPDITLTELLSKGIYTGNFTPNAIGDWKVVVHKPGDEGQVVKRYSVGDYNVHSIGGSIESLETSVDGVGSQVTTVESKIDSLDTKVGGLDTPPMIS